MVERRKEEGKVLKGKLKAVCKARHARERKGGCVHRSRRTEPNPADPGIHHQSSLNQNTNHPPELTITGK